MVLIGNKCDRTDKKISTGQGEALAKELGIQFFETRAKNKINVDETCYYIAKEIKDKRVGEVQGIRDTIKVKDRKPPKKKGCWK